MRDRPALFQSAIKARLARTNPHSALLSGFTLLELLVVIGLMSLLLVAVVPAVTSLSKSNNINTAGRMVANSLTIARSEAINQRTLIRFEVVTDWPNNPAAAYRKFTLVQHDLTSGTDKQLTKWETLPDGTDLQSARSNARFWLVFFCLKPNAKPEAYFRRSANRDNVYGVLSHGSAERGSIKQPGPATAGPRLPPVRWLNLCYTYGSKQLVRDQRRFTDRKN